LKLHMHLPHFLFLLFQGLLQRAAPIPLYLQVRLKCRSVICIRPRVSINLFKKGLSRIYFFGPR
jgi:hypothetical protein